MKNSFTKSNKNYLFANCHSFFFLLAMVAVSYFYITNKNHILSVHYLTSILRFGLKLFNIFFQI